MIRALVAATKAIVVSLFIATVIVTVAILAITMVISYGCKMALWPSGRGVGDVLFERAVRRNR